MHLKTTDTKEPNEKATNIPNGVHSTQASSSDSSTSPLYKRKWAENFEAVPPLTAIMTFFGFYLLMIMGCINYLVFAPNVAKEKNREVGN